MKDRFGGIGGSSPRLLWAALLAIAGCLIGSPTALAAPSWLAPVNLSAPGKEASNSSVAMDEAGETVAVWERQSETGIDNDVQAATRSPGASFSEPIQLSSAATEPDVAITPAGEAVVLWRHFDVNTGDYEIQVASRPPGGTFSAPVEVSQAETKAAVQGLRIAVNPSGAVAIAWTQKEPSSAIDPEQFSVLASVRPSGGTFSAPTIVSPTPLTSGANASNPSIAIDAGGDVSAAWAYFDGTNYLIQTASRPVGGAFSSPQSITGDGEEAFGPEIAIDSSGAATVVWDQVKEKETSYTVQAASAAPGGSFGAAIDLSSVTTSSGEPVIATAPNGLATVAWTQSNGANNIIQAAIGSAGGSFSAPIAISPSGQEALDPEVAIDPGGASTVVWKGSDETNDIVEAANGSSPGTFSPAVDLSAAGQDAVFPRVAMDGVGDATVVWWRSDGANEIVQAAGYDADAPTLRSISLPSSGTVGVPVSFSVMPIDVWPISSTTFAFGDGAHAEGNAVSHTYSSPGTYQVTISAKDAGATSVGAGAAITILPANEFAIGKLALNRRKGTATLIATVPGPGKLVLSGKGVRKETVGAKLAGKVKLTIRVRGALLKRLSKRGRVRVSLTIAFTPSGGNTALKHKKVSLVKKRR